jgi:hypothetical protein
MNVSLTNELEGFVTQLVDEAHDCNNFIPDEGIERIADILIGWNEVEEFSSRAAA